MFNVEEVVEVLLESMEVDWESTFVGTDSEYFLLVAYDLEEPSGFADEWACDYVGGSGLLGTDEQLEVMFNANS